MEPVIQSDIFDACRKDDRELVEKLYQTNPDIINAVDFKGYTPLILAVYNNSLNVVDFLLEKGANINAQDSAGNTPLMGVCFKGYKDIAAKLINAGADVNLQNYSGATALTFAATFGHLEIAEMLLDKGADISLRDVRGKSPYDHARIQENYDMLVLIERYIKRD